jgi:hypothetical protein
MGSMPGFKTPHLTNSVDYLSRCVEGSPHLYRMCIAAPEIMFQLCSRINAPRTSRISCPSHLI